MDGQAGQDDQGDGDRGGGGGQRHVVLVGAEGQHDEHHLEALQEHALEGDRERVGIKPLRHAAGLVGRQPLTLEDRVLVVERLVARGAQDRLAHPLQAEDQQQTADHHAQHTDRQGGEPRAERGGDRGQSHECGADADERGAPAAGRADREHDRQGLDALHGAGQEHRDGESPFGTGHALMLTCDSGDFGQAAVGGGREWPVVAEPVDAVGGGAETLDRGDQGLGEEVHRLRRMFPEGRRTEKVCHDAGHVDPGAGNS